MPCRVSAVGGGSRGRVEDESGGVAGGNTGGGRRLQPPPLDATKPPMNPTTPSTKFEEDCVDGLSLGDGTVDNFGVNVIIDNDALRGSIFFVGA